MECTVPKKSLNKSPKCRRSRFPNLHIYNRLRIRMGPPLSIKIVIWLLPGKTCPLILLGVSIFPKSETASCLTKDDAIANDPQWGGWGDREQI